MQPIVMKTIRVPLGVLAKVEEARKQQSFNSFMVEALREKAEREAIVNRA